MHCDSSSPMVMYSHRDGDFPSHRKQLDAKAAYIGLPVLAGLL